MTAPTLAGRRILQVEDEFFQALDAKRWLEDAGAQVIGPAGTRDSIDRLLANERFDSAIVDINLGAGADFAVADELARRGIPMIFLTGYDCALIPGCHAHVTCLVKPANVNQRTRELEPLASPVD